MRTKSQILVKLSAGVENRVEELLELLHGGGEPVVVPDQAADDPVALLLPGVVALALPLGATAVALAALPEVKG